LQLDDLDDRLSKHFAARFARPETLDFCEYDVDRQEVLQLFAVTLEQMAAARLTGAAGGL